MKIVSFNINGIRARIHQLEALKQHLNPDVIGLQEVKVANEQFPFEDLEFLNYRFDTHGQKGHYGVALASNLNRSKSLVATRQMPMMHNDE